MIGTRRAIFIGGGLALCTVIMLLPAGTVYKNLLALVLVAIILLGLYPIKGR